MNVILYCRVSTDEQREYGASISFQQDALNDYCIRRDYTVVGCYIEDYSAKHHDMKRPEMRKLYEYCKRHKREVDLILFLRWDRFTRNIEFASKYIREFKEMGITVNSIENPIDFNSPDWSTLIGVYCGNAQAENAKISKRTKQCIRETLKKGKWSNKAPRGYKNVRTSKFETHIEIDPKTAPYIAQAFREVAKGVESVERIRLRKFRNIPQSSFLPMLRNPFYIGKIRVPATKTEPEQLVDGQHEPLIDEETFYRVQDIFSGKKKKSPKLSKTADPMLFLRKFLVCPICGHSITGATSKGNGGRYTYYHCCHDPKHLRARAEAVNEAFAKYVGALRPNNAVMRLYEAVLRDVNGEDILNRKDAIKRLEKQRDEVSDKIGKADDKLLDGVINQSTHDRIMERCKNDLADIAERIAMLETCNRTKLEPKLKYAMSLINNLYTMVTDAPMEVKIPVLGSMFPEKIEFDGEKYRTNSYNKVLDIIYRQTNELRGGDKTKRGADYSTPQFSTRTRARTGMDCSNGV